MYSTHTTPNNAIGGSALCIFQMEDIESVFQGPFKHQENLNANWLPFPDNKVPTPRPGECTVDSRVLADKNVNFIKTHPLMERAVPSFNMKPLLIRVSTHYRFTAVTVDPQVRTINDETFDVIYVGTGKQTVLSSISFVLTIFLVLDEGKILKVVNIPSATSSKAFVISENEVLPKGTPVKQLRIAPGYGKVVVLSKDIAKLVTLNHCNSISRCRYDNKTLQ